MADNLVNEIGLSELMITKFSHDLAGPIGAINNGLEFLSDADQEMRDRALSLVIGSAKQAVVRLQFFRQAYGISQTMGEANLANLKNLIENFFVDTKIILDWSDEHIYVPGILINHKLAKLMLNIIVICSSVLIHGGLIAIRLEKSDTKRIRISAKGNNLRLDQEVLEVLLGEIDKSKINARNVQVYFTSALILSTKSRLNIENDKTHVDFIIEPSSV